MNSLTHEDFLAEIQRITKTQPPDAKFFTVPDLAATSNIPESRLRKDCRKAAQAGILKPARFTKINNWGEPQVVKGYQWIKGKNGKQR